MTSTKHYKAVAEMIAGKWQTHGSSHMSPYREMNATVEDITFSLARIFEEDNQAFNIELFLSACSPNLEIHSMLMDLWEEEKYV